MEAWSKIVVMLMAGMMICVLTHEEEGEKSEKSGPPPTPSPKEIEHLKEVCEIFFDLGKDEKETVNETSWAEKEDGGKNSLEKYCRDNNVVPESKIPKTKHIKELMEKFRKDNNVELFDEKKYMQKEDENKEPPKESGNKESPEEAPTE